MTSVISGQGGELKRFRWPTLLPKTSTVRLVELDRQEPGKPLKARLRRGGLEIGVAGLTAISANHYSDIIWGAPFVAVSYACGDGPYDKPVVLDGCEFHLRENLYNFLQEYAASSDAAKLLWADALCINQGNIREKNEQVQLMTTIYSQATKVIVWLGPAAEDSDWCFDRLNALAGIDDISR